MALTELARHLPRVSHHNRYLRAGLRSQRSEPDAPAFPPVPPEASPSPVK
jgi:putative (di)nucleoside polyphosphate hydrolase